MKKFERVCENCPLMLEVLGLFPLLSRLDLPCPMDTTTAIRMSFSKYIACAVKFEVLQWMCNQSLFFLWRFGSFHFAPDTPE